MTACRADAAPEELPGRLGDPLPGLTEGQRGRFLLGRALFERLATQDEGLGPLFNAERCSDCHDVPVVGGGGHAIPVLKATQFGPTGCDRLERVGGDNIQLRATPLLVASGSGPETVPPEATASVYVMAPPLFGLGLVEAVPRATLAALADPDDRDGDGVSGRLPIDAQERLAPFGRKGDAATVEAFVDGALRFELGFTTPEHPFEEARNGQALPADVDPMPDPEIDREALGLLSDYVRFLAPPAPERPQEGAVADSVAAGRQVFEDVGCAACHVPELRTAESAIVALANTTLAPYSDFLLHDLGPTFADVCGPNAQPAEYRTAPLWGLRHRDRYLHDGRTGDLEEAVAAHGGEAETSTVAFDRLDPRERAEMLRFLRSL
jgi:CxxC motif-containing protein (DUF1111 family)